MKSTQVKPEAKLLGDLGPQTIGFRLDNEHRKLLCEQAGRARMTPHEFARYVLIYALRQPERLGAIEEAILQLVELVDQVRSDQSTVTEALLVAAGGMSQSDAKEWVTQYLNKTG